MNDNTLKAETGETTKTRRLIKVVAKQITPGPDDPIAASRARVSGKGMGTGMGTGRRP